MNHTDPDGTRYIFERAEPWMGGWVAHAERHGKPVTNEYHHPDSWIGAVGQAIRAVTEMDERALARAAGAKEARR